MEQKSVKPHVLRLLEKRGYKSYSYQLDAVNQALTIIEHYGGVIIADVVGLGKSVIAGMVAKHLGRRGMILCPPGLMGDSESKSGWRMYKEHFKLYDWEVRSSGDLEKAANYLDEHGEDIEVIIIDEAHRFRNEDTEAYEYLNMITRNRIVILLTATPFNNSPADIFALLKLFIIPGKSKITLDNNLEARFSTYDSTFNRLSFITKNHRSLDPDKLRRAENHYQVLFGELPIDLKNVHHRAKYLAAEIRKVLEPVLIRRNRLDLKNDPVYSKEVTELSEMEENPRELFFELTPEQSAFYDAVVNEYFGEMGRFKGAIYQPFSYEKRKAVDSGRLDEAGNRAFQQQRNLFDFMRRLLVKRFESSFGAFKQSVINFERVHKIVLEFIENSNGKYILDRKLIEKIYENDSDEIEQVLEDFAIRLKEEKAPKNNRVYNINSFDLKDEFLEDIKSDLEMLSELRDKIDQLNLSESDPKIDSLMEEVDRILKETPAKNEPQRKVIIFTEYIDTVKHIYPVIQKKYGDKVLHFDGTLSARKVDRLLFNFDASVKEKNQENTFEILLTSDKLSEGFNLNRAGAIINYDIPWNPTRVIQRVGRINRIGKKVFEKLRIYNFFPTEIGADIVKSRLIASQKMFLIHNTLGEDAKIFDADEEPTAAELFKRINKNPEEDGEQNLFTRMRKEFAVVAAENPAILERISQMPARVKTAKVFSQNHLSVFRRKGLGFFIQSVVDTTSEKPEVESLLFEDALNLVRCIKQEPRLKLSKNFWQSYETIKDHKETFKTSKSEISLEVKAQNNLQSALRYYKTELEKYIPFIRILIKDIRDYRTLSQYSLRRLSLFELKPDSDSALRSFINELVTLKAHLGENYLEIIERRLGSLDSEIIISVENQRLCEEEFFNADSFSEVSQNLISRFLQADDNSSHFFYFPIQIYVDSVFDHRAVESLSKSLESFINSLGLKIEVNFYATSGSIRKWLIAKLKEPETKKAINDRLKKIEQGIEMSILHKAQAEVANLNALAISKLISSFPENSDGIFDLGFCFVIQKIGEDGKPDVFGRQFTPEEQMILEENPQIRSDSKLLLKFLSDKKGLKQLKI
jgi:superfamily II DNA or RNA helicase